MSLNVPCVERYLSTNQTAWGTCWSHILVQSKTMTTTSQEQVTFPGRLSPIASLLQRKGHPYPTRGRQRKSYLCPLCGKKFGIFSSFSKRRHSHRVKRNFVCIICSKAFKRPAHLTKHMMTHRSRKQFECNFEGCDKSYCDKRSLRCHLVNTHQHEISAATQYKLGMLALGGDSVSRPIINRRCWASRTLETSFQDTFSPPAAPITHHHHHLGSGR